MKRIATIVSVFVFALLLSACGGGNATTDCTTTAVLVTDVGGIDDRSFNQSTHEGLIRFAHDFASEGACNGNAIQSASEADYVPNLTQAAESNADLVVAAGFLFEDSMRQVAAAHPDQKFLLIDAVVDDRPNVASAIFSAEQGSFLAGVAAAKTADAAGQTRVGFIGGVESPIIVAFQAGFVQGVHSINPNIEVVSQFAGSFADAPAGQTIANQMFANDVYIIFAAAGQTGNGAITAAREAVQRGEERWIIGVDRDQFEDGLIDGNRSVILTSMLKKVDVAAYDVARMVMEGTFEGKTLLFDLHNNGVGLPDENPNLTPEIMAAVNEKRDQVINGSIVVTPTMP